MSANRKLGDGAIYGLSDPFTAIYHLGKDLRTKRLVTVAKCLLRSCVHLYDDPVRSCGNGRTTHRSHKVGSASCM
jgi:hypothetical protein